ncbi:MAG TPA: hypothetical protein VG917_01870 [Patescibacteria group bacterium]|nr:hypothetical protein [Patescibacteria group bacterium]
MTTENELRTCQGEGEIRIPRLKTPNDAKNIIRRAAAGTDYHGTQDRIDYKHGLLVRKLGPILLVAGQLVNSDFTGITSQDIVDKLERMARGKVKLGELGIFTQTAKELHELDPRIPLNTDIPRTVFDEAIVIMQTGKTSAEAISTKPRVNEERTIMETRKRMKAVKKQEREKRLTAEDHEAIDRNIPEDEKKPKPVVLIPRNPSYSVANPNRSV